MPKKMFIFRCPDEELAEIQRICADNRTDYTRVVNTALIMLTDRLAKEGVLPERELPTATSHGGYVVPGGQPSQEIKITMNHG
ncbi:MAG: hypothetical protein IJ503_06490 [Akkermansia sp.]|nr:hypothetical protein [Akkermansia sp.]